MCADGFNKSSALGRLLLVFYLLATALITSPAEQLPIRTYTTGDGLLRDEVNRIKQDFFSRTQRENFGAELMMGSIGPIREQQAAKLQSSLAGKRSL